jgi:hypothetical protein
VDTASSKNLIVFIWSDVTDTTAGDFLYITDVQLEAGSTATDFERRPIGTELALCQRYYETSYPEGTAIGSTGAFTTMPSQAAVGINDTTSCWQMQVVKRASPTIVNYGTSGSSGNSYNSRIGSDVGALVEVGASRKQFRIYRNGGSDWALGDFISSNWSADAEL